MIKLRKICANNEDLAKGLMFSKPLEENEGMLFLFPTAGQYSFWNKNVDYPIDLIFLNENYEILGSNYLNASQETPVNTHYLTKYILEVPKGFYKKNNFDRGDYLIPNGLNMIYKQGKNKKIANKRFKSEDY